MFESPVHDLRSLLRLHAGRKAKPSSVVIDSRTLWSTPESGARAGYDGAKLKKGSKVHVAVDTLGHLLALPVTPATDQDRAEVVHLAEAVRHITGRAWKQPLSKATLVPQPLRLPLTTASVLRS